MRERTTEVFSFGPAVLTQHHLMVTHLIHIYSLYSRIRIGIQIGIQTVVGNRTQIEL